MKLYDVPRNTNIRLVGDVSTPPGSMFLVDSTVLQFKHIDGMYSYCVDSQGNIVHPAAYSEVEIVK